MKRITPPQLWSFFYFAKDEVTWEQYLAERDQGTSGYHNDETSLERNDTTATLLERDQFDYLKANKDGLIEVLADIGYSENHPGGGEVADVAQGVIDGAKNGYSMLAWYGPRSEVLVAGYRPDLDIGWPD